MGLSRETALEFLKEQIAIAGEHLAFGRAGRDRLSKRRFCDPVERELAESRSIQSEVDPEDSFAS